jgi:hypothetical protein
MAEPAAALEFVDLTAGYGETVVLHGVSFAPDRCRGLARSQRPNQKTVMPAKAGIQGHAHRRSTSGSPLSRG